MGDFIPESLANYSDNLSTDLGGREELEKVTKGATEGEMEGHSRRGHPQHWTEVILVQTFF